MEATMPVTQNNLTWYNFIGFNAARQTSDDL
jgi:hypothetical protein